METITDTTAVNTEKVEQMLAQSVIDARAALAVAKKVAEQAEEAFRTLGVTAVILEDGTKVAIVEQNRRTIDQEVAREVLPEGQHQRLSKRVVQQALVDEAVSAGWLAQAKADQFTKATNVKAVKVTQPKR